MSIRWFETYSLAILYKTQTKTSFIAKLITTSRVQCVETQVAVFVKSLPLCIVGFQVSSVMKSILITDTLAALFGVITGHRRGWQQLLHIYFRDVN